MYSATTGKSCKHSSHPDRTWARRTATTSSSTTQRMVQNGTVIQYSTKATRATGSPRKPSVIKNCQVIRMLTAYAVTTYHRAYPRPWLARRREKAAAALPGRGIAASFRFTIHAWATWMRRCAICLLPSAGVRHRRPGLHGLPWLCEWDDGELATKSKQRYWPARGWIVARS